MLRLALGAVLLLLVLRLAVAAVRGRVSVRSCCAPADPRRDLRMRGAFDDPPAGDPS